MFCKKCGKAIPNDALFCTGCGTPIDGNEIKTEAPNVRSNKTKQPSKVSVGPSSPLSTAAIILGIISVVWSALTCLCGSSTGGSLVLGIAAIITGYLARAKAKEAGIKDKNADTGYYCGIVSVILNIILFIFIILLFVVIFGLQIAIPVFFYEIAEEYQYYFINSFLF